MNHVIVCGVGDTGVYVVDELIKMGVDFVVIEQNESRINQLLETREFKYVIGDATDETALYEAGVDSARSLAACLAADRDNLFLVITAKSIRSDLRVISKATRGSARQKLLRGGADEVIIPEDIGVKRVISVLFTPQIISFMDEMLKLQAATRFSESEISPKSELVGKNLIESAISSRLGLTIVAIRDGESRQFIYNPPATRRFKVGDVLIVIGTQSQMAELALLTGDTFP